MKIRRTKEADIPQVLEIYEHAKKYMAENGNPNQWNGDYPTVQDVIQDIKNGGYVIVKEPVKASEKESGKENPEEEILGVFVLEENAHELAYDTIEGCWLNDEPYAVIHRCATLHHQKGIGQFFMDWCLEKVNNIRVDTHKDNWPMLKFLEKNNFSYCGKVYYEVSGERLAFHLAFQKRN